MPHTRQSEFVQGMRDTLPLIVAAVPFGFIFGALATAYNLTPAVTMGLSTFVFAGSAQFIALGLINNGASAVIIILTTFVVNLRHALYSTSLATHLKGFSQGWLIPLAFWLTDETYAVVISRYERDDESPYKHWYHLGSSVLMYVNWQLSTIGGFVAGQRLETLTQLGLDFAMVVTFIGLVVPLIKDRPMLVCALVAGVVGVLTNDVPNRLGLIIAAVAGIIVGLGMELSQEQEA